MTQTINRIYATADAATGAVKELNANGFLGDEVHVVGATDVTAGKNSTDDIVAAITNGNVLKSDAAILAEAVKKGGTLVTVHAVFGAAVKAIDILDSHGPVESGLPDRRHPRVTWDEAAPLSSALRMPVALNNPTVFETFSNLPTLAGNRASLSDCVGMPTLAHHTTSLSALCGMPLLSNNPAPLSSLFHIPLLTGR